MYIRQKCEYGYSSPDIGKGYVPAEVIKPRSPRSEFICNTSEKLLHTLSSFDKIHISSFIFKVDNYRFYLINYYTP